MSKNEENKVKKCLCCKKSITLLNFKCSYCEQYFCVKHRLPEDHECTHDYKHIIKTCNKKCVEAINDNHNYIKI